MLYYLMILDKQDIYSTSNITSGSFLGYLNSACFLSLTLPTNNYTENKKKEHDASVPSADLPAATPNVPGQCCT